MPDPIQLDLDASGYVTGLGSAGRATEDFGDQLRSTAIAVGPVRKALDSITPSRALMAGVVGFTAVAGKAEQQLSTLKATSKTTGANFDALSKGTRELARDLPIGNAGARELVGTITKLGVATKGSESSVVALSKTFTRLGGATGENASGLAAGMIQLSRATGTGFNAERMENLADSLTTVSAKSGASATGITQFAKAIAPMAQASGIGTTKILGISSAFSKMGEDGFGAANAFNKMLGDLNRSVREGSPEMSKYAQIVGKSAVEFERMFKADPTEAITQVTEAIGKAGNNGPRLLEGIGLDGVRTQRYLQQLSTSGGLRQAVQESTDAYGSGSTKSAADVAFGGLADSTARLKTVLEQTAEAIGTPFLGAMTLATDVMGSFVSAGMAAGGAAKGASEMIGIPGVVNLGDVFKGLTYAALPLLAAFKIIPSIITALGLSQLATSGPLKGALGGYARNENAPLSRLAGYLGGNAYNRVVDAGIQPGSDRMAPINKRAAEYGGRVGGFLDTGPSTGPSLLRQITSGTATGAGMYLRTLSESSRLARLPFELRGDSSMRPISAAADTYLAGRTGLKDQRAAGTIDTQAYRAAMKDLRNEALATTKPISTLTRGVLELGKQTAMSAPVVASRVAGAGARGIGTALGTTVGALGGLVGLGLTGAMVGAQFKAKSDQQTRDSADASRNKTNFLDDYQVAMGKATMATSTFAGAMADASKARSKRSISATEALRFTDEDEAEFGRTGGKGQVKSYSGNEGEVRRRIMLQSKTTGFDTDEIQRIQQDVRSSGYTRDQVESITAGIGGKPDLTQDFTNQTAVRSRDIGRMKGEGSFSGAAGYLDVIGGISRMWDGGATRGTISTLSKDQEKGADELVGNIDDRSARRSEMYSPGFAKKAAFKEIDAAVGEAFKSGNTDLAEQLQSSFQNTEGRGVSGGNKGRKISEKDINENYGGSYTAALAGLDEQFRGGFEEAKKAPGAAGRPVLNDGYLANQLQGSPLTRLFSANGKGDDNAAVQKLVGIDGKPEDPSTQLNALQETLKGASAAGTSMQTLADQATNAANKLGSVDSATTAFLTALRSAAKQQVAAQAPFQSSGATMRIRAQMAGADAALDPSTPENAAIQRNGVMELIELQDQVQGKALARLNQERELGVQRTRMGQDFRRQQAYGEEDYERGRVRAIEQYGITVARSEKQFLLGRARSAEDYRRSQRISQRDFDKNMARQAQDGARSLYDAYTRIQVQPTWDARNLGGNLREQNDAIKKQVSDLGMLRKQGGSADLIALMGLNDPKNAQQLANLVSDVANDPRVLTELNKAAADRQKLGGKLVNDKSNIDRERARKDFSQAAKDNTQAFATMMKRGAQDYATATRQMAQDQARALRYAAQERSVTLARSGAEYRLTLTRMQADVKRGDTEIVTTLAQSTRLMGRIINGQVVDFRNITKSTLADTLDLLKDFGKNYSLVLKNTGVHIGVVVTAGNYTGSGRTYERQARDATGDGDGDQPRGVSQMMTAIRSEFPGTPLNSGLRPGAITATGNPSYHGMGRAVDIPPKMSLFNWIRQNYGAVSKELIFSPAGDRQIKNGQDKTYTGVTKSMHYDHIHWAMAKGGIAKATPGGTKAIVAEAGSNELVMPLNSQGAKFLAEAMKRFVSVDDVRGVAAAQGVSYITYDSSTHTYDHSNRFEGAITVQANDPDAFVKQMAARAARTNLTAPPQRKR